jgi:Family of unknown function (DUF6090)
MRWRQLHLDWSYGVGELVIVVVGVLIALAVNSWNDDRLARGEEAEIVARLASDLHEDLERLGGQSDGIDAKEASLLRLQAVFATADPHPSDPAAFLHDVINGANYGWTQFEARRTTFRELVGSGKFSLIRDPALREMINEYYDFDTSTHERIDDRQTNFPHLAYLLVPRENEGSIERETGQGSLRSDLSAAELEQLTSRVLASGLEDQLVGELNLARFVRNIGRRVDARCRELIARLEVYGKTIR